MFTLQFLFVISTVVDEKQSVLEITDQNRGGKRLPINTVIPITDVPDFPHPRLPRSLARSPTFRVRIFSHPSSLPVCSKIDCTVLIFKQANSQQQPSRNDSLTIPQQHAILCFLLHGRRVTKYILAWHGMAWTEPQREQNCQAA